ncbi:MAG: enterochelin esterase [Oscillospiraceae bacterium]|nr:enterochelin esterase [Oscillospiraceae bacterium]
MKKRKYQDNTYRRLPDEYILNKNVSECRVVRFNYTTRNYAAEDNTVYNKYALVYLPEGYDENNTERRYNVLYLIHGGACSPEWYLGGEGCTSEVTRLLDNMIQNGLIEPLIVCAVSWLNEYSDDATENCLNFRHELINDIMPLFERKYRTYAEDVTERGFVQSRKHRAFSGYSMGAVVTWNVLGYCMDKFAYFMPMSGDCWELGMTAGGSRPDETAAELAREIANSGFASDDIFIYAGCGDADIAEPNLTPQINAMKKLTDTFIYSESFNEGNLYECICPDCGHDLKTALHILYNGLPKMFG